MPGINMTNCEVQDFLKFPPISLMWISSQFTI